MSILRAVLLLTLISGVSCQSDSCLYFSDYVNHEVYKLDLDTMERTTLPITGLISPLAVDYDYTTGYLYIANVQLHADNATKFFLKYHLTTGRTETYYLPRSFLISAMALDPVSQLIYYAERTAQVIYALTTDFKYETVIVNEILNKPSSLVLDIGRQLIYWSDWSKISPEIGKASMDGTNPERLIVTDLKEPYAVGLDSKDERLYWADNSHNRSVIETSKTDGTERQTLVHLPTTGRYFTMSFAIDENYVYWMLSREGTIRRSQKYNFNKTETIGPQFPLDTTDFRSLRLVKKSPPPIGTNACSLPDRGGCQHICIPTSQSRVCRCAEAHILQPDGTSCKEASFTRGLVTTDVNRRILLVHDLDADITKRLTDLLHQHDNPLDVAFDDITKEVYWQDRYRRGIYRICIHKPCYQQIRQYREKESFMSSMALDTGRKMIYVCDFGLKKLSRLSYSGTQEEVLVTNLTTFVTRITLDTSRREMYWADEDGSVEVADMDMGANRKVLLSLPGAYISGLEVDSQARMLYILDYNSNRLLAYDINKNSEIQTLYQANGTESLYGLAIGDGILYFADRARQSIHEFDLSTNQTTEYGRRSYKRVVGMTYFNFGPSRTTDRRPPDIYRQPVVAAATGGGLQHFTLIIAMAVAFGGLFIIILLIACLVFIYKRKSTTGEPEAAPPNVNPPMPLDMMACGPQLEPLPLGVYGELFCGPDDDEPKKQPLPPDNYTTSFPTGTPLPTQPPPYEPY